MSTELKIKYLSDIKPIEFNDNGNWIDLRSAETYNLNAGEFCKVHLGVAIELPKGYEAIVAPRSSTFVKWGIIQANSIGVIDESYCGDNDEWMLPVIAFRHTTIHKNDRICQFRIFKHHELDSMIRVKSLGNPDRNGFGSTGVQ